MGAFASGVMAVFFGGVTYGWNSGQTIGLFCCSGVLFVLLGLQQIYAIFTTTSRRTFPVEFFKSRTMLILFAMTVAGGTAIFIPIYTGLRLLPFVMLIIFAAIRNGAILSTYGYYMPWYTLGGLLCLTGGALMYTVSTETLVTRVYGYSIIIELGDGLFA
ncbi:hypothetical protein BKA61DRAFT_681726 [Leptodontidium sp. MPI-SDFR-AT-0119]|nr:hypothetical protein BKA61DRAFT_681726 [Leptodontidium sp. MPI-SDFR-AT-0119]